MDDGLSSTILIAMSTEVESTLWNAAAMLPPPGSMAAGLQRLKVSAHSYSRLILPPVHRQSSIVNRQYMILHPTQKGITVARDRVPGGVEGVVAPVVAVGVGWARAARNGDDRAHRPVREDGRVGARRAEVVDNLLHRDDRPLRREHDLLLDAGDP